MNNLWLKIKIWTKIVLFTLLGAYLLVFVLKNTSETVKFWYFFTQDSVTVSVLTFTLAVFFIGVIGALLTRMVFRTVRQMKELSERNRLSRIEQEQADMKAKAAKLQSAPTAVPPGERKAVD